MSSLSQVVDQMQAHGLPMLPHGHPVLDGKVKRFGPGKKSWYALREVSLKSGEVKVSGAFGVWQGTNNNATLVAMDWSGVSAEERAAAEKKQREHDAREAEKKARLVAFAANRARVQWDEAATDDVRVSPYLERKQVPAESVRITEDGTLLVPMRKYALDGARLVGLQKVAPDGTKRFNKGMDKTGAGCLLGALSQDTPVAMIGEGYATCASVRMAFDVPVMVAFDAGNLSAVAKVLRRDFPTVHLLFTADDDRQLEPRLHERLLKEFGIAGVLVDGVTRSYKVADAVLSVTATWRKDVNGVAFIEADVRGGRVLRTLRFENAGLASAKAAAAAVGNASVVYPRFPELAHYEAGYCDFNDLHVNVSLEAVRVQIGEFIAVATGNPLIDASVDSPVPSDQMVPPPDFIDDSSNFPAPLPGVDPEPVGLSIPTHEALIAHFSLIYPTTDIWDGLKRQRLKKSAFEAWVGKDLATAWAKDGRRRTILRESLPALVGGRAVEGGAGGGKLGEMLDNITLLRGTETVWDAIGQQVMTLGAVRADYTADMTSKWQEHGLRKTVEAKNLVFDPTQQVDPVTHVNMFLGWPLSPKKDMALVGPILALLDSLCAGEDNHDECVLWILKWLAFPLQNPGAKMQTALLMFGEKQGTGKSLLFQDVIAPIYGDYGTVASQHQLDSTFTAWRSRKLFVLFEEVLSRDDKYSHNGTLKYMVTGTSMSVNQKNLPERTERNHLNTVFLSNEPQPIPIELEDRRFFVIEARNKQPESFYNAVKDSITQGGVQAFYQFLLDLPLDGFNEHTKPMMTLAKERVIEFGLNGWMSFHRSWKDGYLSAPYCSCLTEDLYQIYKRWCDRTNERPLTLCKFSGFIASREHKVKRPVCVGAKGKTTRMVYEIQSDDATGSLDQQIEKFRKDGDVRADV